MTIAAALLAVAQIVVLREITPSKRREIPTRGLGIVTQLTLGAGAVSLEITYLGRWE